MDPVQEFLSAVQARDEARVRALLDADPRLADARGPDGTSPLLAAAYARAPHIAQALVARGARLGVLEAAALGQPERLRELLRGGPDAMRMRSPEGWTPLHLAALFDQREAAEALLRHGADPDAPAGAQGYTPLHVAAGVGSEEVVDLLLQRGASPSREAADGRTPMAVAVEQRHAGVAERLRAGGAPP